MRNFDFSIMEIKDVLSNFKSESDLKDYLKEKAELLKSDIRRRQQILGTLQSYISSDCPNQLILLKSRIFQKP